MVIKPDSVELASAIKGRLIRDSFIRVKKAMHRQQAVKLINRAEALIPEAFTIVDEAVSSGYIRLTQPDQDQNLLILVLIVSFSIYISWFQALTRAFMSTIKSGVTKKSSSEGVESNLFSLSECMSSMTSFGTSQYRIVARLLGDILIEAHNVLDYDGDGYIGIVDLWRLFIATLSCIGRLVVIVATTVFHYVLALIRKLVDIVLPVTPVSNRSPVQFHQNSPRTIIEEKLLPFYSSVSEPTTITSLAKTIYDRLAIRGGPKIQLVLDLVFFVCQTLSKALQCCQVMVHFILFRFCSSSEADQPPTT